MLLDAAAALAVELEHPQACCRGAPRSARRRSARAVDDLLSQCAARAHRLAHARPPVGRASAIAPHEALARWLNAKLPAISVQASRWPAATGSRSWVASILKDRVTLSLALMLLIGAAFYLWTAATSIPLSFTGGPVEHQ